MRIYALDNIPPGSMLRMVRAHACDRRLPCCFLAANASTRAFSLRLHWTFEGQAGFRFQPATSCCRRPPATLIPATAQALVAAARESAARMRASVC